MSDITQTDTPIDKARAVFEAEGIPMPPLTSAEEAALQAVDDHLFATRAVETSPYTLDAYLNEVLRGDAPASYVLLGFAGGGVASSAFHYFVVEEGMAIFVQIAWGGGYTDEEDALRLITRSYSWVERTKAKVREAREKGVMPADTRMVAVVTQFGRSGSAFVRGKVANRGEVSFSPAAPISKAVDTALDDLIAGRTSLT